MISITEKILNAAENDIRSGGYNNFNFSKLATSIDTSIEHIERYFPNKDELTVAVVQRYRIGVNDTLAKISQDYSNIEERLYHYASFFERAILIDKKICPCTILGAEIDALPTAVQVEVKQFFIDNINWLSEAIFLGEKGAKLNAQQLIASLDGAALLSKLLDDPGLITQLVARFTQKSVH
ncbi:TetR/AcrR family transcriptional regulator [uncultured Shewanella sp.]|uniref:TetR/AcrR family transcriptional regulator n=1 Tax=uncultured Shewanella sp. TaxID=173975 RepID=UPI002635898B|nr:TetR/AcrR family transcriptional regulator [uncultured Shewanella sp.]